MERVLVVPRVSLLGPPRPAVDGFQAGAAREVFAVIGREGYFTDRAAAEEDPSLKQIIPYAVVSCESQVFLLERRPKGGESRLHGRVSLGVGGHVNPQDSPDGQMDAVVENAFERELHEELHLRTPYRKEVMGVLNDDSDPVGQVHFGIVYSVKTEGPQVAIREKDSLKGGFVGVREVFRYRERMESWSRILLENFWSET